MTVVKPDPPAPSRRITGAGLLAYERKLRAKNAGDFIDDFIDALREESPGSDCYDEDTLRSVLGRMLSEEGE